MVACPPSGVIMSGKAYLECFLGGQYTVHDPFQQARNRDEERR